MNIHTIPDDKSPHHSGPFRAASSHRSACLLRFSPGMKLDAKKNANLIGQKKLSSSKVELLAMKPVLTSGSVEYAE
ncbi:hypothetical protein [Tardiphaga sp. OK245]|uniref:hypothetical protein n=1 Tax=Tardiphaga sp. OK245 TaxID=1855306 RepID=UPI0011148622|nr:hypothetical protein [Tardiphaga sp. OK245]